MFLGFIYFVLDFTDFNFRQLDRLYIGSSYLLQFFRILLLFSSHWVCLDGVE
jgi:hypothetical protein